MSKRARQGAQLRAVPGPGVHRRWPVPRLLSTSLRALLTPVLVLQIDKSHPIHPRNDGNKKRKKVRGRSSGLPISAGYA